LRMFRELDQKTGIVYSQNYLGELARLDGDYARAGQLYEECLTLSYEVGNREREATILGNLSYVAYHLGNFDEAMDYCKRSLALASSLEMEYQCAIVLAEIAGPISAKGDPKLAACLLAASKAQFAAMGANAQPADKLELDLYKKAVRQQLGETEFNKAWDEGQRMTMEQALAMAMEESTLSNVRQ
jgi:tetratricopeptide (TPR) repeat protein